MTENLIVGCGLIGLTTALELLRRGQRVRLIDSAQHEGLGASYANGGLLTPSMSDPWNAPGIHKHLLEYVVSSKSALKLRLAALPSLTSWGPRFLLNSSQSRHRSATLANLKLSEYSLRVMEEIEREHALTFDSSKSGSLKIFRSQESLESALALSCSLANYGLRVKRLDARGAARCEPFLASISSQISGAIYYESDASGDAHSFCRSIARIIQARGGVLEFGRNVRAIEVYRGRVIGVQVDGETIEADRVIVAAGVASPSLLSDLGVKLQLKPVKGYSVTYSFPSAVELPKLPVIDDAYHAAITPLGNRLRVAGTAEFAGMDLRLSPARVDNLSRLIKGVYPDLVDEATLAKGVPWAGLRPVTADGQPYIGASSKPGLWINTGHGHLGWTMAAGSARILVDQMEGRRTDIDASAYRVDR